MTSISDGESNSFQSFSSPEIPDESNVFVLLSAVKHESSNLQGAESSCLSLDSRAEGGGKMKGLKMTTSPSGSRDDKLCRVCGDRALGCNFDAISCESCKAFFRRNALKEKQTKCIFEGKCRIDVNTRRFCPYCRLNKCFAVGMRKDLILGEDAKKKRMEKVLKKKKPSNDDPPPVDSPAAETSILPAVAVSSPPPLIPGDAVLSQSTQQFELLPENTNLLSLSKFTAESPLSISINTLLSANLNPITTTTQPDALEYTQLCRILTPDENHLLQELLHVYDLSFTVDLEPLVHIKKLDPSLNQLVNQSSITILRLIKFAKRLEEFVHLPQQCQIGILKGCWIHILILRSVSVYDSERDVWVTPRGDIPTEILKNATGFVQLHDDHVRYCKSIKSIIGDDIAVVIMLLVIVLFSPEGPHVIMRELVSNIQDRYLILLKHYLESKYTYIQSAEMFPQLMSKIKELKDFAEVHGKCLVDINPSEIEPIMLEILDLK